MLRITSGTAKNKKLKAPKIQGFRAIQEVARLAIFSMLGEKVVDATCLDLFAGSGSMGIEALSRGAGWCDFVDENRKSTDVIEKNLLNTHLTESGEIHRKEAVKFVADCPNYYDIVFVDPFYKDVKHKFLMELSQEILNENGVIVFFHGENLNMKELLKKTNFVVIESRRYGRSFVDFLTSRTVLNPTHTQS